MKLEAGLAGALAMTGTAALAQPPAAPLDVCLTNACATPVGAPPSDPAEAGRTQREGMAALNQLVLEGAEPAVLIGAFQRIVDEDPQFREIAGRMPIGISAFGYSYQFRVGPDGRAILGRVPTAPRGSEPSEDPRVPRGP